MKSHILTIGLFCFAMVLCFSGTVGAQQKTGTDAGSAQAGQSAAPPSTNPAERAIYPAKGQDSDQQMKDQLDAYNWATQQTGWDPYKAYDKLVQQGYVAQSEAEQAGGRGLKGAAGGALAGLAIGSLAGEAGKGAAIGAVGGGVAGGVSSRRAKKDAESKQQQAIDAFNRQFAEWDKHYVVAMEGKGYTIK